MSDARFGKCDFGLTVFGGTSVQGADVTVSWQRPQPMEREKSHTVRTEELKRLLSEGAEHIIVGTGWSGLVRVEQGASGLEGLKLEELPTPQAVERFNELADAGTKVAALIHSTC